MVWRRVWRRYCYVPICLVCTLGLLKPLLFSHDHPVYFFREQIERARCRYCRRPMRTVGKFSAPRYCCDDCRRAARNESNKLRRRAKHKSIACLNCGRFFVPKRSDAMTCSNKCRQARARARSALASSICYENRRGTLRDKR